MNKIQLLKPIDLNCGIFSIYDYKSESLEELLCMFFTKINELIENGNYVLNLTDWLVNKGLSETVAKQLVEWLKDGTLSDVINKSLFKDLSCKLELNSKIIKDLKDKTKDITEIQYENPFFYGYTRDQYINGAIEKIVGTSGSMGRVRGIVLPSGIVKINKPLKLDRNNFIIGNNTTIIADYPNWEGVDYTALYIEVNSGVELNEFFEKMNKTFNKFTIRGLVPQRTTDSTGIKIMNKLSGEVDNEVIRSLVNSVIDNVHIDNFENGIVISECWNSSINTLSITNCKKSFRIDGQSVNLVINDLKITNPNPNFEDVNNMTFGILTSKKENKKETEGITFNNPLIYGCDYNIYIQCGYLINFDKCISDGAKASAYVITNGKDITIKDSYLCVIGGADEKGKKACVELFDSNRYSDIIIKDCKLVAVNGCLEGIRFSNNFTNDRVLIEDNKFESFVFPISGQVKAPSNSKICGNYFINTGSRIVNVFNGFENTLFDNNIANNNVYFFDFAENSNVSPNIRIGNNKSLTHSTYMVRSIKLSRGGQDIILPTDFYDKNVGLSTLCRVYPLTDGLPPYEIKMNAQWANPQIKFKEPLDKDYSIQYECFCVKFDN